MAVNNILQGPRYICDNCLGSKRGHYPTTPFFGPTDICELGSDLGISGSPYYPQDNTLYTTIISPELQICGDCKVLWYCSKECQKQAWKHHHKYECKSFAKIREKAVARRNAPASDGDASASDGIPNEADLPIYCFFLRLLAMRDAGKFSNSEWEEVLALGWGWNWHSIYNFRAFDEQARRVISAIFAASEHGTSQEEKDEMRDLFFSVSKTTLYSIHTLITLLDCGPP